MNPSDGELVELDAPDRHKRKANGRDKSDTKPKRFALVSFDDIPLVKDGNYIIKGLFPREGLIVVWGPPKCGKTFWTWDALMHVALGWPYRGRRVCQGVVVYIACEGERGFGARAAAFREAKLTEEARVPNFRLMTTRLDLVGEHQELIARIGEQLGDDRPVAICIDTLNRSIRGSESSDEDMGNYVKAGDAVREAFRCAVFVIHHCGIEGSRPRGHTCLSGAVDAQIAVKKDKDTGIIACVVEHMKDGPEGDEFYSTLEVVEVGEDNDGDPITSCVILESDEGPPGRGKSDLSTQQRRSMESLETLIADFGQPAPNAAHYPPGVSVVPLDLWRNDMNKRGILSTEKKDTESRTWRRIREKLHEKGRIGEYDGLVWPILP